MRNQVAFDIETVGLSDAGQYFEPVSAPANYKDPEKIAAYIADANKAALAKAALDVDLCRVVAIGRAESDHPQDVHVGMALDEAGERQLLEAFWLDIGNAQLVGFNILDYDLPVLMRRSLYLNVPFPKLEIGRYRHDRVTDLMQILSFDGKLKYRGLSFYCRRFGIPNHDETTGADIAGMVERGDWAAVEAHCRQDVEKTVALAQRLGVLHAPAVAEVF